jgi:AcrR family transcriptional regulator
VELAAETLADQGFSDFSLDELAARADVTRNLLYHYFPRGRQDIIAAVAEYAGRQMTESWIMDESIPLPERMAANLGRLVEHAMTPTDAWRLTRIAQTIDDPEIRQIVDRFQGNMVSSIALNQLGTSEPPPVVHLAIKASIAFTQSALDQAREAGLPPEYVIRLVAETLPAAIQAAARIAAE